VVALAQPPKGIMEKQKRLIRRCAVFFFLGTLFWSASVSPQHRTSGRDFADEAPATTLVRVPPVVNMRVNHAEEDIVRARLRMGRVTRIRDDRPRDVVARQSPAPGTTVPPGSSVALWVSLGPEPPVHNQVQVPNLFRKDPQEARELLKDKGLSLGDVSESESTTHPQGTIMRQKPRAEKWVNRGDQVNVWIARRPTQPPQKTTRVPDLRGRTLTQAKGMLRKSRLRPGAVGKKYSLGSAGGIVAQEPLAGIEVRIGSVVNLWEGQPIPLWIFVVGGLMVLIGGYVVLRALNKGRPKSEPPPLNLKARATDEDRFEAAWVGGKQTGLELRLRARPDLGVQDLEAPGPLIKRERRGHE
jgi:beta-lactam-binding protein with PASTA domain